MISHSSIIRFVFAGLIAGLALPLWASTEREAWYKERRDKVERVLSDPNENTVRDLIEEFSGMEYHLKKSTDEYRALFEDMRQTLAGVSWLPGYQCDRILKARTELEAADEETRTGRYYKYDGERGPRIWGTERAAPPRSHQSARGVSHGPSRCLRSQCR